MDIPVHQPEVMIDFIPFIDALEKEYGFAHRDMAGKSAWRLKKRNQLCAEWGIDYSVWSHIRPVDMNEHESKFHEVYNEAMKDEPPYLNGWHYLTDHDFKEFRRAGCNYMYFEIDADGNLDLSHRPEWIRPLYAAIYNEVKDHDAFDGEVVRFYIDW